MSAWKDLAFGLGVIAAVLGGFAVAWMTFLSPDANRRRRQKRRRLRDANREVIDLFLEDGARSDQAGHRDSGPQ